MCFSVRIFPLSPHDPCRCAGGTLSLSVSIEGQPRNANWVDVVAFKKTAQKLQQAGLGKGKGVSVIGYWHEKPGKTGKAKPGKELYAAMVKSDNKTGQ